MNLSLYQAAAALDGNIRWQQMIAENLAAGSAPGFKKSEIAFSSIYAGNLAVPGQGGPGQLNPTLLPSPTIRIDNTQGSLRATQLKSDLALDGPGYFEVRLPDGRQIFTRDGEFRVNPQGELVTKNNDPLLSEGGVPIIVDPRHKEAISIAENGVVSQNAVVRGKLRVVEFEDPSQLMKIGGGYYIAPPGLEPAPAERTQVAQGYVEAANSAPTTEMSTLMMALRHFEANQRVIQMQDERMGRMIQDLSATT